MPDEIAVKRYSADDAAEWNSFVSKAKNSTFLFNRQYMDYHSDRFVDHSVMIYSKGKLSALFVANQSNGVIESHGGLTYGGMILEKELRLEEVLRYFYHTIKYYSSSFKKIVYKSIPSYLTAYSSNEDQYALFLLNAVLFRRDTSMVLERSRALPNEKKKTSKASSISVTQSSDPINFWSQVLIPGLKERFGVEPVHTVEEMKLLMDSFPENIKLYEAGDHELLCGAVVYVMPNAVHLQYLSSNSKGREIGAVDVLVHKLIDETYADKKFFSLGTSNADNGRVLNRGLATWKERFGARTWVHDFYEILTANYGLLKDYE